MNRKDFIYSLLKKSCNYSAACQKLSVGESFGRGEAAALLLNSYKFILFIWAHLTAPPAKRSDRAIAPIFCRPGQARGVKRISALSLARFSLMWKF
jgi:hypothetical protein